MFWELRPQHGQASDFWISFNIRFKHAEQHINACFYRKTNLSDFWLLDRNTQTNITLGFAEQTPGKNPNKLKNILINHGLLILEQNISSTSSQQNATKSNGKINKNAKVERVPRRDHGAAQGTFGHFHREAWKWSVATFWRENGDFEMCKVN